MNPGAFFELSPPEPGTAIISDCGLYRYDLTRTWNGAKGNPSRACFVMLNPSTADDRKSDPTMTRCVNFAKRWGYDGLAIVNLFAYRATEPRELTRAADPIGPLNDEMIARHASKAALVVCAWGCGGSFENRDEAVMRILRAVCRPHCLKMTKQGHPQHPLYMPADSRPFPMPEGDS